MGIFPWDFPSIGHWGKDGLALTGVFHPLGAGGELEFLEPTGSVPMAHSLRANRPVSCSPAPGQRGGVIIPDSCSAFIAMALPHQPPVFQSSCLEYKPDPSSP